MKTATLLVVLLLALTAHAQDYIIQNDGTAAATLPKPVTLKTTTTGVTAPKVLRLTFEYTFGADATAGANGDRDLIVCCATTASASTDNLAKSAVDRCFASQYIVVTTPADATTKIKHVFSHGVKSTTNYVPTAFIGTVAGTGADMASKTGSVYTSPNYDVDHAQLASFGLITTAPGTLTFSCTRAATHATSNTLVAGTGVAIPTGTATTFTLTGSGTACSTSSTSKSSAFDQVLASFGVIATLVALLSFE